MVLREAPKDNAPEHIKKYRKLSKQARKMIATTEKHHRNAYDDAVDAVLVGKDGLVDMDRLGDIANQDKMADKMADSYLSKAKQAFKIKKGAKFDHLEEELLMNAHAGVTRTKIRGYIHKEGKGFTFDKFDKEYRPQFMKGIAENLGVATMDHFKQEHVKEILDYTGASKFLNHAHMNIDQAVEILNTYDANGIVPEKHFKKSPFYKKQEKK